MGQSDIVKIRRYGAYGIVIVDQKILLTRKKKGPYIGKWDLPGGGIEFGESPEQTLLREFKEELAAEPVEYSLFLVATHRGNYQDVSGFYSFHHVGILYHVKQIHLREDLIAEEEIAWVALDSLNDQGFTPFVKEAIYEFKNKE